MNFNDQNFLNVLILLLVVSTGLCIGYILRLNEKVKYWKVRAAYFESENDVVTKNYAIATEGNRIHYREMQIVYANLVNGDIESATRRAELHLKNYGV
jgi:hypothetical protein